MSDMVQEGRHFFAGICDSLPFEIDLSPVYADEAAKHVEPANFSLCFNRTVGIGLCAENTNLNGR